MRRGALLNDDHGICIPPTSVAGGDVAEGNWLARAGFCGPGSMTLAGFVALIAPCGGRSGLPKLCACAFVAAAARVPAAVAPRRPRRDVGFIGVSPSCDQRMLVHPTRA